MKKRTIAALFAVATFASPAVFGAATALQRNVQITEVNFEESTITLKNLHPTIAVSMTGWRFCSHDEDQTRKYSAATPFNGFSLAPGETLTIHFLNDSGGAPGTLDRTAFGGNQAFALPLDRGPYAIGLYNADAGFNNGFNIVDHVQWSVGGVDNTSADERSDEAQTGGVWTNQSQWVATTSTTLRINLAVESGTTALHGATSYTVTEPSSDTTKPTLVSITDATWPSSATAGDTVVYTVTFSEGMDGATIGTDDFDNGGSAGATVSAVSTTGDTAVFEVTVDTTSPGDLTLQIKAGAVLTDLAGNELDTTTALVDDTTITVNPVESIPPTLVSITDNTWPSSAFVGDSVIYTVTFDEGMDPASVGADDFENGGSAGVNVSGVSTTGDTSVFEVSVDATSPGDLTLRIKAGASLLDLAGNPLETTTALSDDTTILIAARPAGGAFDTWAATNGVPAGSEGVDSDEGGKNNFYEFALGGNPSSGSDDGSLLHHFVADGDGDSDADSILTILVRSGASFSASGNEQAASIDGVSYTVSGDSSFPVGGGVAVSVAVTTVSDGLPPAPAGYEYVSFILAGSVSEGLRSGYYKVTVSPAP